MSGPLPAFLVIGAMKAGTTSLHHYLDAHPGLCLPRTKELNFFVESANWRRGESWYREQFAHCREGQVPGEVSPDYTKHPHHPGVAERVGTLLPDVKLVYLLRQPIDRMGSMFLHQVLAGRERRPIDEALLTEPEYLEASQYMTQLDRYLRHVDRSRVLLVSSETLASDAGETLAGIHEFIGVTPMPETAATVTEQWYRTDQRRRRGTLARIGSESAAVRKAFARLPEPVRQRVAGWRSTPLDPRAGTMSQETVAALRQRLQPDLARLHELAPEIVEAWDLLGSDATAT